MEPMASRTASETRFSEGMSSSPVAWRPASSRRRPAICGSTESRGRFMRSLETVVLVMKYPHLAVRHRRREWAAWRFYRMEWRKANFVARLAANHAHLDESPSLLRPTSPTKGGIANQCQCLEQIFSRTSHGCDEGAFFCCSRVRCRLCSEQRWLFARKKRILFPATPKSRNWENRNSGRIARFATA